MVQVAKVNSVPALVPGAMRSFIPISLALAFMFNNPIPATIPESFIPVPSSVTNTITGNSSFTINGANVFYDADAAATGSTYNGNVSHTVNATANVYIAQGDAMQCSGNVTMSRTVAGTTYLFFAGSNLVLSKTMASRWATQS